MLLVADHDRNFNGGNQNEENNSCLENSKLNVSTLVILFYMRMFMDSSKLTALIKKKCKIRNSK